MKRLSLKKIEENEFDSLTFESNIATLVFFGARRCPVCREQMPILEKVYYEYKNEINVYWVDVDKNKELFHRFRLCGIPNILIFNDGEVKDKIRGLNSKETLIQVISKVLYSN